ncbi:D-hexose-6-phosphate mutarotase [Conservatibacter flavescens]|uniref:Putative glucose-6-phosphate 1-epimerase n=1 Tax=Conservatibacter flavescens TaxID=28161 RepID=A0A2M8S590_9PAST|nr:D-hexose-6-phosphate mutarotase [Conservatibacter flavescens]PJG86297.1 D-hexose-6-phosphate mutarotase [Conservatibacter flavescens]
MTTQKLPFFSPHLKLVQYQDIPVLVLEHSVGSAKISLQGGQLLSWKPANAKQDLLWLSEVEPFKLGNAIRGGVPICYPWFGKVKEPAHGTARLRLWELSGQDISDEAVLIELALLNEKQQMEAKIQFHFTTSCEIRFTHYGETPAQVALHSYFNVSNIADIWVENLPTECFNSLTQQTDNVESPRKVFEHVDCIYQAEYPIQTIVDPGFKRSIDIVHNNASEIVFWNPWHTTTSGMSNTGYQTMLCVETARLSRLLAQGESIAVRIIEK